MAWSAPRTWVTGEIVNAAEMNTDIRDNASFLRETRMTPEVILSANVGPTSGTTELTLATLAAFTADGATVVALSFNWYNVTCTVTTDIFQVRLREGATLLQPWLLPPNGTANLGSGFCQWIGTPSAGSHTYNVSLLRVGGTGTATYVAAGNAQGYLSCRRLA